jgi:hypothetical protein
VEEHLVISVPASTAGVWLHEIVLVRIITIPPQEVVAVTVSVAVKEPFVVVGLKYANAGLLF